MTGRAAVIEERASLTLRDEASDIRHTDLHLERRRHAVERLEPVAFGVLSVGVQIDETGRHDQAPGVDDTRACQRFSCDSCNRATGDANVHHPIHARFGIDDAASPKDHVVPILRRVLYRVLKTDGRGNDEKQNEYQWFHRCLSLQVVIYRPNSAN